MNNRREINPEYVYVSIPAEYICVYHRILAMLADYGEDMLKDCKAACKDRNSGVIECFNMFNAAVAARKLGKDKLAETLIKYIKAKINQIYNGKDNSTEFVFPIDEHGTLKAFISCNGSPRFWIDDNELLEAKDTKGIDSVYSIEDENNPDGGYHYPLDFTCEAFCENKKINATLKYFYNGSAFPESELDKITTEYYVNSRYVRDLSNYEVDAEITVMLTVVAYYKGGVKTHNYAIQVI